MNKKVITCPNCNSAIHLNESNLECQNCGLNITDEHDEKYDFMELVIGNGSTENSLQILRKNCERGYD